MATRATWTFHDKTNNAQFHVYTHWDGYPAGAADKLEAMLESDRRGFAERFLEANPDAELSATASHCGQEYHYVITRKGFGPNTEHHITAYRCDPKTGERKVSKNGDLEQFIREHRETETL